LREGFEHGGSIVKWLQDGGPEGARDISLLQIIQTDCGFHPVSLPAVLGIFFLGSKLSGAWISI